ncbi:hypothetical protein QFC21_001138 [Naganishia friedmannii]|uniref:Uncharacterized protein n=1 Tax=Naganishia friedmannii TaxID=89922 RepID=A0ACC2W7J0_9TREE|nr:hypothetical protein QFC21_001138 [Naganishia friedmannii]
MPSKAVPAGNNGAVIANYPLPAGTVDVEMPDRVRKGLKEKSVEWCCATPRSLVRKESDASSLIVGPGTDLDDFDQCWTLTSDGFFLTGTDGLYVHPAFLFINRKNPSTPALLSAANSTPSAVEVCLCLNVLQRLRIHLPPWLPLPLTALDDKAHNEIDNPWGSPPNIAFGNVDPAISTPGLSFSPLGTVSNTTSEDGIDAELEMPGHPNSATCKENDNALGLIFDDEQPQRSFSGNWSSSIAHPDEEAPPRLLSATLKRRAYLPCPEDLSKSHTNTSFTAFIAVAVHDIPCAVQEGLYGMCIPRNSRPGRKPLPLVFRVLFGALEWWIAPRTEGMMLTQDREGEDDGGSS